MNRKESQFRSLDMRLKERDEGAEELYLEGYFAVYGSVYELWPGATESIAPGAFADALGGDIRALYNHNQSIVLGRTSAGTLTLKDDGHGLWGRIRINKADTDAMNAHSRVSRGDVSQCSFGFEIEEEEFRDNGDGTCHWTIKKINPLYEISPCVFPAYKETTVSARRRDFEELKKRELEKWRADARRKLGGK